jgi:hypothetical protein
LARKANQVAFNIYRYQILPVSQTIQLSIDEPRIHSVEDLVKLKNEFFAQALRDIVTFEYPRGEVIHRKDVVAENLFVIRFAARRRIRIQTRNFTVAKIDNFPTMVVGINNDPNVQTIAIQINRQVFASTETIRHILEENLSAQMRRTQLIVRIEPIFDEKKFWDEVRKYDRKIVQTDFELISPNMANIAGGLTIDLDQMHRSTNTKTTHLQLNSDKDGSLTLTEDDPIIKPIVDYVSAGGGNISMKIRGLARRIHTSKGVTQINISEVDFQQVPAEVLEKIFRGILK